MPDSLLSDDDVYLFNEGSHRRLWEHVGAHPTADGTHFAVWAPAAPRVSVVGDFNGWNPDAHPLQVRGSSGIWHGFVPGVGRGAIYKYRVGDQEKADPLGVHHETPPKTASIVWDLEYAWGDASWMAERASRQARSAPMSIYEVHVGSWMRHAGDSPRALSYRELAPRLADHVERMGFTHVELMPVMEHPFHGSWGYQVTGYFAPSSRYGTPQDLMHLIDVLHQRGIGVILDWVPAHFPTDGHGLGDFDGTHLYEHSDPRQGFHPDWNTYIFNYGRHEVRSFLVSSALFWLDAYHVDGLRVDGVASMLYLDYSRAEGEWIPNAHGGRENLEAIALLEGVNDAVRDVYGGAVTIAEESTAWPKVSRPTSEGGLGFTYKWDMGWMHDTLAYLARDPIHRRHHHHQLTFRGLYAYDEDFVLPLSHDEVVHGKGSLLGKMPGDEWQRFANLRLLYAYMWSTPGKKLLFMGGEIAMAREWDHDGCVHWTEGEGPLQQGCQRLLRRLNELYRERPALHARDHEPAGFCWLEADDADRSVYVYERRDADARVVVALNCTPVPRHDYPVRVDVGGRWRELLNTDAGEYGGSGVGNQGEVVASPREGGGFALSLTLPPLAVVWLEPAE